MRENLSLSLIEIVCYHTCSTEGGADHVRDTAPFKSGSGSRQWLTQGYYFWTDSDYFAHWWGRVGYKNKYAIIQCKLIIDDAFLLDLVGSVACQLYFAKQMKLFQEKLRDTGDESAEKFTVNDLILHLKGSDSDIDFPFIAIKSQDIPTNDTFMDKLPHKGSYPYRKREGSEIMPALTRQQICLFEIGYESVVDKKPIHPNNFRVKEPRLKGYKLGVKS